MKKARYAASIVAIGATAIALTASPALADKVKTHLIVEQGGSPVTATIELTNSDTDASLTTHLDDACLSAFEHAKDKTYGVTATADKSGVVEISPGPYSGQDCKSVQDWTLHAVGDGIITIQFNPVTTQTGLQGQMGPAHVTVEVTGFDNGDNGGNPPGHKRPAAPAVANAHVPHGSDLAAQCKAAYGGVKNWHGLLIKAVSTWSRENHLNKLKQTYSSDDAWVQFVDEHVDGLCTPQP